jgi:predicted O-linked N-acetylglucosamine transferase (SPINDLY family)
VNSENSERKPGRRLAKLLGGVRSALNGGAAEHAPRTAADAAAPVTPAPAPKPTASELINEGLRQRQEHGVAAAQPFFETAAQLEPNSYVPFFMLGNVSSELGDLDTAVRHYEHARDLQPSDHVVRYNLGLNHLWRGYVDLAIEELRAACNLNPAYLQAQSTYLWALHNSGRISPEELAAAAQDWGVQFALQHPEAPPPGPRSRADLPEVLRVGFVSGDFRTHSVAHFFEPIAGARNRGAFKYVFYSTSRHQDTVTQRLRAHADEWRDVAGLNDDALIELIRADGIDILVDLAGHTELNRLAVFARRAAPVQVSYLGYPDSTGLPTMDYRITDVITDPEPAADAWHNERLLRLPDSQWCFRPFGTLAAPGPLPARKAGFVTFGSFNNISKVSDIVLHCWAQILVKLPTSRLHLTRVRSPQRAAEILALFRGLGVAAERIDCVPYRSEVPHGVQFAGVDIALDPYPYNGVTTTCESLYFGLPVISLHGRHGVSRSGLSILASLGLRELAAPTSEQYTDVAVALALDLPRLESLRASLRSRFEQSPLRDEKRLAANFEALLRTAWRRE